MKLPNGDRAVVEIAKLRDYCLNPDHPRGKHKARVFQAALGITADQAENFQQELLHAAKTVDATPTDQDEFGQRYLVDFMLSGPAGHAIVRSAWIVRTDE